MDEIVRSLAALVCGDSAIERLTPQHIGELAFLLECVEALAQDPARAASRGRGPGAAVEELRARLTENVNEVELVGRRDAA